MERKYLLVWKSKTTLDSYRVIWKVDTNFIASYLDSDGEWMDTDPSYTAEQAINWITSGDVRKDVLIV